MNPFDYLKAINETKKDIMVDDIAEKEYNPFIINRGLSFFRDTILYANEMNRFHHLDHRLQFDFFIAFLRPGTTPQKTTVENEAVSILEEGPMF